ncbi:MAG TPA: DUF3616 domain-containing protein [Nakamurella sp.]
MATDEPAAEAPECKPAEVPTILLQFTKGEDWQESPKKMRESVSAMVRSGDVLWVASDQTASVERLVADDEDNPTVYGDHRSFRLTDFVALPQGDEEVDLEGIDLQWVAPNANVGYLWLVGSHSWVRGKVDKDVTPDVAIGELQKVTLDRNRCVLIRIPVRREPGGLPMLVDNCPDPRKPSATLAAGLLTELDAAIAGDEHLGLFSSVRRGGGLPAVPGKDNGVDIEGLAVSDDRVFVGMRGPVLRGWAVVLQLAVDVDQSASGALRLRPTDDGRPFRKFFLDLGGLGVRELIPDGSDLLVLAGPTMVLDGPVRVHRWLNGATGSADPLVRRSQLPKVKDIPYGDDADHAEGITLLTRTNAESSLLVTYDSPAERRIQTKGAVQIDRFPWP